MKEFSKPQFDSLTGINIEHFLNCYVERNIIRRIGHGIHTRYALIISPDIYPECFDDNVLNLQTTDNMIRVNALTTK